MDSDSDENKGLDLNKTLWVLLIIYWLVTILEVFNYEYA